ncbi:MAG: cytochrome c3 family protein [Acidobacteriota bacterium]|nr:cytochrome c3 family protein [Acidobacteriota bacterium]
MALLLTVCLLGAACSREGRVKLLEALFDDPPSRRAARQEEARKEETAAPRPAVPKPASRRRPVWEGSTHGPYAARLCQQCHAGQGENPAPGAGAARLRLSRRELCLRCHGESLGLLNPLPAGRRPHGPVAAGECMACHLPHRSRQPMLLRGEVVGLCTTCHRPAYLGERHPPVADAACVTCHDPHFPLPARGKGAS